MRRGRGVQGALALVMVWLVLLGAPAAAQAPCDPAEDRGCPSSTTTSTSIPRQPPPPPPQNDAERVPPGFREYQRQQRMFGRIPGAPGSGVPGPGPGVGAAGPAGAGGGTRVPSFDFDETPGAVGDDERETSGDRRVGDADGGAGEGVLGDVTSSTLGWSFVIGAAAVAAAMAVYTSRRRAAAARLARRR